MTTLLAFVLFLAQDAAAMPSASPSPTPDATTDAVADPVPDADADPGAVPVPDPFALEVCAVAAGTGSPLPGATVILLAPDGSAAAATAGSDGCARFTTLPPLTYKVTVTAPGSRPTDLAIAVGPEGGVSRRVALEIASARGEEMIVEARREQIGETRRVIQPSIASTVPGSQGDALKAIQNLPGLARVPFGGAGLLVRGSAPEDTKVFLDGQEIPQIYHFGGITSVIATDMLESIDFLPGGFGVRYGRATGGVVDVETHGAREDAWSGSLDADIFDAEAIAQGALAGDDRRGRLIMAARRSYIDVILPAVVPADTLAFTVAPRYYDYQIRYDAPSRENGARFNALAYGADDALTFVIKKPVEESATLRGKFLLRTLFHRAQAQWVKPLPQAGWVLTVAPGAGWRNIIVDAGGLFALDVRRPDFTTRAEARGPIASNVRLLTGFEGTFEESRYTVAYVDDIVGSEGPPTTGTDDERTVRASNVNLRGTAAGYVEAEIALGDVTVVPGVRTEGFLPTRMLAVDPRLAMRWAPAGSRWSAKSYLGLYHQPPQPYEWDAKIGNPDLRPPSAIQTGAGGAYQIDRDTRIEAEVFWKWLDDAIAAAPADPGDPSTRSRYTNDRVGRAYGAEMLLRRDLGGKVYGWLAYTLSRSERADPYTPGGWRPFEYDQTHIVTAVAGWKLPRGWLAGARFRYTTGNPETPVVGAVYDADRDVYIPVPGDEGGGRVPSFNQLDFRFDKTWDFVRWNLTTYLDVQNVYVRANPEGVRYDFDYDEKFYVTGLPLLPSIGVKGEF